MELKREDEGVLHRKDLFQYWNGKIETEKRSRRRKDWVEEAKKIVALYECRSKLDTPFNILNSNTEILLPALLGECPKPIVKRRFNEEDAVGDAASEVLQKTLKTLQDPNEGHLEDFEGLMREAVLSALVPGIGVTCFHYNAEIESDGESDSIRDETILGETIEYDKILIAKARNWARVPWIAYEFSMTRPELVEKFGAEIGNKVELVEDEKAEQREDDRPNSAVVWQIWDKTNRNVVYISTGYDEGLLKVDEDPLGLEGFFNIPKPMQFLRPLKFGRVIPLYDVYRIQAEELNVISTRINKITRMLKVRGAYDGQFQDLAKVLSQDDGGMIPLDGFFAATGGKGNLDATLWLVPIDKLVSVLQQLYVQREQCKQTIYELTGISDIMRGASRASETLGAQTIKQQSGSVRLRKMQKEVARYARDCLRLMSEIAAKRFSKETWKLYSEVVLPTDKEKKAQLMQLEGQVQMLAQQNPQAMEQIGPILEKLKGMPTWEDVIKLLKDEGARELRIDIETDSTLDVLATEDKVQVGEFLNALAQFLNGIMPLMEQGLLPFEAVKSMMIAVLGKFRFSEDVMKDLEKLQQPLPKQEAPDPAAIAKAQSEQVKAQGLQQKMQMDAQKGQMELQKTQLELEGKKAEAEVEMQKLQAEMQKMAAQIQVSQQEMQQKLTEVQLKGEAAQEAHKVKMEELYAKMLANEHKFSTGGEK